MSTSASLGAPPAPRGLAVAASGRHGVELTWTAVPGADRYRVEYTTSTAVAWSLADARVTTTPYTVSGLSCRHVIRLQGELPRRRLHVRRGLGVVLCRRYDAYVGVQRPPAFQSSGYSFSVREDAAVNSVGDRVSDTNPDAGDVVSYSISARNDDGKFSVSTNGTSTEIRL